MDFIRVCLFHPLTGLNCPGCGMTRSLYALLHGDFRLALKDNALFVAGARRNDDLAARGLPSENCQRQPAEFIIAPAKSLWAVPRHRRLFSR